LLVNGCVRFVADNVGREEEMREKIRIRETMFKRE
jgi:hypothetical protein